MGGALFIVDFVAWGVVTACKNVKSERGVESVLGLQTSSFAERL